MRNKSFHVHDRRKAGNMPVVPFRDSNGVIIIADRRKLPDRRLNSIQADWVNEILLSS